MKMIIVLLSELITGELCQLQTGCQVKLYDSFGYIFKFFACLKSYLFENILQKC